MTKFIIGDISTFPVNLDPAVITGSLLVSGSASGRPIIDIKGPTSGVAIKATGSIDITGDLTIHGTTTTINSTTLTVDDKNIELGSTASPSDTSADGGGITLKGASDYTISWTNSTDRWHFNQGIQVDGYPIIVKKDNDHTGGAMIAVEQDGTGDAIYKAILTGGPTYTFGIDNSDDNKFKLGYHATSATEGVHTNTLLTVISGGGVGIGEDTPLAKLHVKSGESSVSTFDTKADDLIIENNTNAGISIAGGAIHVVGLYFPDASDPDLAYVKYDHGANAMAIRTNGSDALHIDSSQRLGIGVGDPDSKLEVLATTTQAKFSYDADSFATVTVADASHTTVATGESGNLTLDAAGDIALSADGGNVTMDDGTNTIFDFNVDDTALTIHDDQDTGDKVVMTVAQHGAFTIETTDDDAAAANIQITADGTAELAGTTVTLDSGADVVLSAAGGNVTMDDGSTTIFDFNTADTSLTIHDDQDTGDTFSITVAQHGETTITTVDDDATAANLILDVDGDIRLNAAGGDISFRENSEVKLIFDMDQTGAETSIYSGVAGDDIVFKVPSGGTEILRFTDGGQVEIKDNLSLKSDAAVLKFGASEEVTLTHNADKGLLLKHTATADDKPVSLTLQTGETDIAANDVLGKIDFQAPDEGTGTDAILVAAGIEAVSEGDFSATSNATKLSFKTGASEAASEKMSISSVGNVTMKNTATGDDTPMVLTLQTGETDIAANDVIGKIDFQAPDEGTGTDAILVAAGIEAVSEGDFSASSNATKLAFKTAASEAAAEKMTLTSDGKLGVGVTDPDSKLEVLSTSTQAKFSYDSDSFATITVADGGGTTIETSETGNLTLSSDDIFLVADGGSINFADPAGTTKLAFDIENAGGLTYISNVRDNDLVFRVGASPIEVLRIDQSEDSLRMNTDSKIQFRDPSTSTTHISSTSVNVLNITAPTLDIDASTAVTIDTAAITATADTITMTSANANDPLVVIKNTTNDTDGARLRFVKDKGAAGADNDIAGLIEFYADDDNQDNILFAKVEAAVADASNGAEGGKLTLSVATHDGEIQPGLILADGSAEDEVDVTIGNGAASVVSVPGFISIGGVTINDIDTAGEFTDSDEHLMTAAAINDRFSTSGGGASALDDLSDASFGSGDLTITSLDTLTTSATAHNAQGTALLIQGGSTTAGTTNNIAGGDLTLAAGQGKGSGAGGDIVFKTANAGGSGSSLNALATALTISDDLSSTFTGNATFGVDDTGVDVRIFSATASEGVLYDASEDELGLLLTTKLKFHDIGGGEEIFASANGHLEINSGTTLDMTAPTVDINASTAVTIDSPDITITSSTSAKPVLTLSNTNADANSAELKFNNDSASGADSDVMGKISFYGTDAAENAEQELAFMDAIITDSAHGSEAASMRFFVAENDGTRTAGLVIAGQADDDGEVDVTIGAGAASTTTVAGDLTVTTDLTVTGADIVLGGDSDGTDRTVTFGHSTLKTIMGIDDSADAFVINTDAAFDSTLANNSLSIDASHNMIVAGNSTVKGRIICDDTTAATSTTDGSLQTDGGLSVALDAVIGDDIILLSDSAAIQFGTNSEVTLTHDHDKGLLLKHTATGDDKPVSLTLQTGETDIAANDVIGKIDFQAPDEGAGTDAILVAAGIEAVSEGDFADDNNATKLSFKTGASEAAAEKVAISSGGNLSIVTDGAAVKFGADAEVTLTHVHNTGLLLSDDSGVGTTKLMFGDSATFIQQQADGQLGIDADSIINITAPTVDIDASTAVTIDGPSVVVTNAATNTPVLEIKNTHNGGTAGILKFNNLEGSTAADGADGDDLGSIQFWGFDDGTPTAQQYAGILAEISDASSGAEGGKLSLQVAEHDGTVTTGLLLQDGNADGEIDVTIGAGTDSLTTIAGDTLFTGIPRMNTQSVDLGSATSGTITPTAPLVFVDVDSINGDASAGGVFVATMGTASATNGDVVHLVFINAANENLIFQGNGGHGNILSNHGGGKLLGLPSSNGAGGAMTLVYVSSVSKWAVLGTNGIITL